MSRVGKLPINIPSGVEVIVNNLDIKIKGPKGEISKTFKGNIDITLANDNVTVRPLDESVEARAMWGTARSIINGMMYGAVHEFKKELELVGVGYRASLENEGNVKYLNLSLGKSHNTKIEVPSDINVEVVKQTSLTVASIDKQRLGQFVAVLIKQRPPEPYKGKGIRIKGQYIIKKEGKKN